MNRCFFDNIPSKINRFQHSFKLCNKFLNPNNVKYTKSVQICEQVSINWRKKTIFIIEFGVNWPMHLSCAEVLKIRHRKQVRSVRSKNISISVEFWKKKQILHFKTLKCNYKSEDFIDFFDVFFILAENKIFVANLILKNVPFHKTNAVKNKIKIFEIIFSLFLLIPST